MYTVSLSHVGTKVTTYPHTNASSVTIELSVIAGLGGTFAVLALTTFLVVVKVYIARSRGKACATSAQQHRSVEMEPTVIYEEINQCEVAAPSEIIAVQEKSTYVLVSH